MGFEIGDTVRGVHTPTEEPTEKCPRCGGEASAEWVDNGFGPYAVQAGPYHCFSCGWTESGCPASGPERCARCTSEHYCHGAALAAPLADGSHPSPTPETQSDEDDADRLWAEIMGEPSDALEKEANTP